MSTNLRGIGSDLGGVLLVVFGAAGFILEPAAVARLLTILVIYVGVRDVADPYDGRPPSILVLMIGIWSAVSAYKIWQFDFLNSWPLLVVLVGVALIFQGIVDGRRDGPSEAQGSA